MSCDAARIVGEALNLAKAGDLAGAEKRLEPIMETLAGTQMYGLLVMMAGKTVEDFAKGYTVLAEFDEPTADLEVVRSLYEIFDLHGANDVDAGIQRLVDAEAIGSGDGFGYLTYLLPALARSEQLAVEPWMSVIERISDTLPHFAMSLVSLVDTCVRDRSKQATGNPLLALIKSVTDPVAGPLNQCPKLVDKVMRVGREFGKPCLLGLHLRLPKIQGDFVARTLRSHPQIKNMPWEGGVQGFGNADDQDIGWISYEQDRISAICTSETVSDINDLPGQADDCFAAIGDRSELLFGDWEIDSHARIVHGYAIDGNLGRAMYITEYNESYNNQGFSRIERQVILFAPELDQELAGDAARISRDGRSGSEVSLTESGRDLAAERAEERLAWLEALRAACADAGNEKAEAIVAGVDAEDEQSVEAFGERLYYTLARSRNSMEADPEGWFEDDDEGHRGFVADFVKLAGKELKLTNLESDIDDEAVETVRCDINGERFEARADNQFNTIDMNFVWALMQHCKPLGNGCYINLLTSDGLALAYVPKAIGEILIERSSYIGG